MTPDELEAIKEILTAPEIKKRHLLPLARKLLAEVEHLQQYKEFYESIPTLPIVTCPDECGNKQANTGGPMLCAGCEKWFLSDEWS